MDYSYDLRQMHTREAHSIPLALTASITASTFFSRARAFAFRVADNFQGVFLGQRFSRDVHLSAH